MKQYINIFLAATALTTVSCSDSNFDEILSGGEKEKIEFSLSDATSNSRAGFGGSATFVAMRMQSNEKGGSGVKYTRTAATATKDETNNTSSFSEVKFTDSNVRYWDDAHGRKSLLSVYAVAIPNIVTDKKGIESKLAKGDNASAIWGDNSTNTIEWTVTTTAQTKDVVTENTAEVGTGTIDNEDLVYSNNIQADKTDGIYRWNYTNNSYDPSNTGNTTHHNGQMLFFQDGMTDTDASTKAVTDAPGHFDRGHLVFNHALTRFTITIVEGAGFNSESTTDFQFTKETASSDLTNITLLNMYTSGTLNLTTGEWGSKSQTDVKQIAGSTTAAADTYYAQILPDYEIKDGDQTNVMKFSIDNNTYFVTQDMLYDALVGKTENQNPAYGYDGTNKKFTMKQGKNYNFTITVNKASIANMTATLTPWANVTAQDMPLDNRHVEFTFLGTSGDACTAGINLYQHTEDLEKIYTDNTYITVDGKGKDFSGNYLTKGNATLTLVGGIYKSNWFFENDQTAYHLRTISDNAVSTITGTDNTKFTMTGANTMPDYHWGAPMKTGANLAYDFESSNGYKANLSEGLISTVSEIKIREMHMLSNINITLETSTDDDKVDLSGATIKLTRIANTADVDMGTGYITPTTTYGEVTMASPSTGDKAFKYAVIPQTLVRGTGASDDDYVGISITTSDNNQYYIIRNLSNITISDIKQGSGTYTDPDHPKVGDNYPAIKKWYPNHTYNYNFKITKKGIDTMTATVTKWVNVTANGQDINLEN